MPFVGSCSARRDRAGETSRATQRAPRRGLPEQGLPVPRLHTAPKPCPAALKAPGACTAHTPASEGDSCHLLLPLPARCVLASPLPSTSPVRAGHCHGCHGGAQLWDALNVCECPELARDPFPASACRRRGQRRRSLGTRWEESASLLPFCGKVNEPAPAEAIHKVDVGQGELMGSRCPVSAQPSPGWACWQAQPLGQDLQGGMGCAFARVLLTPLLQEQIQRYFILCTFV